METTTPNPHPDIKNSVLSRIEREGVCPRARWQFVGKECAVWMAWGATVALAAIAVAVSFFVIAHRQYTLYEATHDSFWGFMLEVLPYVWFAVFAVSGALALYHLRHTKRGYRYPLWTVALASIFLSLVGGTLLHLCGMSFMFDSELGEYMPGYVSQNKMEKQFWQQPEDGRLLGTYIEDTDDGVSVVVQDMMGVRWVANTSELHARDLELLRGGAPVRLLGMLKQEAEVSVFHACGVFPWMYDHMVSVQEMYEDREEAIARLREHKNRLVERVRAVVPPYGDTDAVEDEHEDRAEAARDPRLSQESMTMTMAKGPVADPQCPNIKAVQRLAP